MNETATRKVAGRIDAGSREMELGKGVQDGLQLVAQSRRRPRTHADETIEVVVESRLEISGILPRFTPLLDTRSQLGDDRLEVYGAFGFGIMLRIRRHGRESSAPRAAPVSYAPALASYAVVDDRVPDPLPYGDVRAEIEAAASETAARADFPSTYLSQVHSERERFALRTADTGDIRAAIALLEEQTNVHALAPVESRNRGVSTAKLVVRKAVFFAANHLAEQMRALGWAAVSVGEATAERIEKLEARVRELEARLDNTSGDSSES